MNASLNNAPAEGRNEPSFVVSVVEANARACSPG
jgi:hypothetical protein